MKWSSTNEEGWVRHAVWHKYCCCCSRLQTQVSAMAFHGVWLAVGKMRLFGCHTFACLRKQKVAWIDDVAQGHIFNAGACKSKCHSAWSYQAPHAYHFSCHSTTSITCSRCLLLNQYKWHKSHRHCQQHYSASSTKWKARKQKPTKQNIQSIQKTQKKHMENKEAEESEG